MRSWAPYIDAQSSLINFLFLISEDKDIKQRPKIVQKCLEILYLICFTICSFLALDQIKEEGNKKFLFLRAAFEQISSQKASSKLRLSIFKQLFEKFRETVGELSSNLWKALVAAPQFFYSGSAFQISFHPDQQNDNGFFKRPIVTLKSW